MIRFAIACALLWTLSACDEHGHDHGAPPPDSKPAAPAPAKPYPLDTCVVSGEKLGKMGEPKVIVHEGQEVKFCCPGCEKEFRKDPAKVLKAIAEAKK
jgi:YHS domain-containing protein